MNDYYVYGYIRLDTNSYFYIGKGKGDRCYKTKNRNEHFLRILDSTDCVVEILYDRLTEFEAFELEISTIEDLVFNEGYSIDVKGFNHKSDLHLTNATWGGEGSSGRIYSVSDETKIKLRDSHLGKSPNMTEEAKRLRGQKIKDIRLVNNSYGHSQETKDKISETLQGKLVGKKNGKSKAIICLNDGKIFESCRQAALHYGIRCSGLSKALNYNNGIYDDLHFKWLNDYNTSND